MPAEELQTSLRLSFLYGLRLSDNPLAALPRGSDKTLSQLLPLTLGVIAQVLTSSLLWAKWPQGRLGAGSCWQSLREDPSTITPSLPGSRSD